MKKIYIDYFSIVTKDPKQKAHGGGNYARRIIQSILENHGDSIDVVLLCPKWYEVNKTTEPVLYSNKRVTWIKIEKLSASLLFEPDSILYYPILVYYADFLAVAQIKQNNPSLKIAATIHDLRTLQYTVDWTEKYYYRGLKRLLFPLYSFVFEKHLKIIIKKPAIKKALNNIDEVYTDSNYSMQQILKLSKNTNVRWYYLSSIFKTINSFHNNDSDEYILFVSGVRRLKNLSNALLAFSQFKTKNRNAKTKLVITGIDKNTLENLLQIPGIDSSLIRECLISYDYVSNEQLAQLYSNCKFILYLSKAEGFGLPVLEAALYGKTCVASNAMSISEVIGNAVRYVCPTDVPGITRQIEFLLNPRNLSEYEKRISDSLLYLKDRMDLEEKMLLKDLLS